MPTALWRRVRDTGGAIALAFALACQEDSVNRPSEPYGTYSLRSIDGQSLPYVYPRGGNSSDERITSGSRIELVNGWMSADDYHLTWEVDYLDPRTGALLGHQQVRDGGFFRLEGNTVHFDQDDPLRAATGTLSGDRLTVLWAWSVWPDRKRLVFER